MFFRLKRKMILPVRLQFRLTSKIILHFRASHDNREVRPMELTSPKLPLHLQPAFRLERHSHAQLRSERNSHRRSGSEEVAQRACRHQQLIRVW